MISRRTFASLSLGSLGTTLRTALSASELDSNVYGVQLGVQSYSFRDRPLDAMIAATADAGLSECELWQGHAEPKPSGTDLRQELRRWRTTVPMDVFTAIREKFHKAGIALSAYNYSFRDDFTAQEIERGFEMARALGVNALTASSTVSVTKRVAPVAARYKMIVGMHGHNNLSDPNEFAKPESFISAMKESAWIGLNLDIGHFVASGYDPVSFLTRYYDRVVTLHIKDRKKNGGPNMPFGQGDTPVREVLQVLKQRHSKITANIEYAYNGGDSVAEVRRCYQFCKEALS